MKKILNIFDTRIMIWFHYILLTGGLFISFYLGEKYLNLSNLSTVQMFIYWFLTISIIDQLIHSKYVLNVD